MTARSAAVLAVQLLTLIGAVVVVVVARGPQVYGWLTLVLALSVVAGFIAQLLVGEQQGFVVRSAATVSGSLGVVALAAVVAALLGA